MDQVQTTDWITHPVTWAAGLAGGMVSMAHMKGLSVAQRLSSLVVGVLTAGFITPAMAEYWLLTINQVAAMGFAIGVAGMFLTAIIFNMAAKAKDDPASIIDLVKAVLGRGNVGKPPTQPGGGT